MVFMVEKRTTKYLLTKVSIITASVNFLRASTVNF